MTRPSLLLLAALLCLVCSFGSSQADTVTVPCDRDNTLYENGAGVVSNGAGPTMFAGRTAQPSNSKRRGLIHFNVAAAVPAGSTITAAAVTLHASMVASAAPLGVSLHRVLADWGQGTSNAGDPGGAGAAATAGDATWLHRFFNTTTWTTAGGDFAPTVSALVLVEDTGAWTWGSTAALVSDVQAWVNAPATNFGWLARGEESIGGTSKRFDTREAVDPAARPSLVLEFTPPGTPAAPATWGRVKASYR